MAFLDHTLDYLLPDGSHGTDMHACYTQALHGLCYFENCTFQKQFRIVQA